VGSGGFTCRPTRSKYIYIYIYIYMTQEVNKFALPGFRHSVDWWGPPTRLEWALAPDRGAGVT